jgi:phage tail sheath protein FI
LIQGTSGGGGGGGGTTTSFAVKKTDGTWSTDPSSWTSLMILMVSITVVDDSGQSTVFDSLGLDSNHPRYLGTVLARNPTRRTDQTQNMLWADIATTTDGPKAYAALTAAGLKDASSTTTRYLIPITGGSDGQPPTNGSDTASGTYAYALRQLDSIEDISIIAAPGHSALDSTNFPAVQQSLIGDVERTRAYRIAVLDSTPGQGSVPGVLSERGVIDSTRAAFYWPWVVVANPLANPNNMLVPREVVLPPSGFVCGIYARNDTNRGVVKAPANEIVIGALRFDNEINFAQQEAVNPLGVNCLRTLTNRGLRVWGARTASSDPEWKYVSVRRYFNYLERSIDIGTQWAVFEPNGPKLWDNIRDTVGDFLFNEWRGGALLGDSPKQGFFVKCDRSTMDQNDLDNGRLVCLIGVAVVKPAEFVIFRIGQITADARS